MLVSRGGRVHSHVRCRAARATLCPGPTRWQPESTRWIERAQGRHISVTGLPFFPPRPGPLPILSLPSARTIERLNERASEASNGSGQG